MAKQTKQQRTEEWRDVLAMIGMFIAMGISFGIVISIVTLFIIGTIKIFV